MPITLETYTGKVLTPAEFPMDARMEAGNFGPSLNLPLGTILAKKTSTGKLHAYAHGDSDGLGTPVAISVYDLTTDANGIAYPANMSSVMPMWHAGAFQSMPVYVSGTFDTTELPNWDATYAVADWGGGASLNMRGFLKLPV